MLRLPERRILRTRWPWLGLGIAILLLPPNLIWQAQHSWPSLHFFSSRNAKTESDTPPGSGVWNDSFYKDEIGWPELASQVALAWKRLPAADRADGTVVAGNYGEASALEHYGPERGLPPVPSRHLSWQYWRPNSLPQRFVLFVGYGPGALGLLCRSWTKLATIDNHWHLANEERGRIIAGCHLKQPLGTIWDRDIARNNL